MTIHAGRRLKVTYTSASGAPAVLVDSILGPATTPLGVAAVQASLPFLHCDCDVVRHMRGPVAQTSAATVYGLSRDRTATIVSEISQARELAYKDRSALAAGMLKIEYGLADQDLTVLCNDVITDARPVGEGVDRGLLIEGVDGRLTWDTLFVTDSKLPTPDSAAEQAGITKPPPSPPKKGRSVTYKLHGAGEADALITFARLGQAPVYTAEGVRWISLGAALLLPPLDLSEAILPPVEPPGVGGVVKVRTLADPGLLAGRQVFLSKPPKPYRLDEVRAALSNYRNTWFADLLCRPST